MGPIAGPDLVAAVSNAGGLGVLGCTGMSAEQMREVIRRTRELTSSPFGVDLILPARLDQTGALASAVAERIPQGHWDAARQIARELGVEPQPRPDKGGGGQRNALGTDAEAQVAVVLDEQVPVFVGALVTPAAFASRLHDAGIVVMSVVGSTKQAVQVARDGADVVIAQGTEGGGHTGKRFRLLPNRWTEVWEQADVDPLPMPLQPVLTGMVLGGNATDRGGRRGVSMNGAGNIAGLLTDVLPAATVVEEMAAEAAARISARWR